MTARLQQLCADAFGDAGEKPGVALNGDELVLCYGPDAVAPSRKAVPVSGASLFSVNFETLARLMNQKEMTDFSTMVQRVDGATCTPGDECHTLLRVKLGDGK